MSNNLSLLTLCGSMTYHMRLDPRFHSPELNVNLCDDGESFPSLESGLEEVFDPPSTTLHTVAPSSSSTLRDNTTSITTFPDTPYPLT